MKKSESINKIRAGSKTHNKVEVPAKANVFTSPLGREAYVTAVSNNSGRYEMMIRFVDGLKPETKIIPYDEKYF